MAETAQALYTALTLAPADRRAKAVLGRQLVERSDLNAWLTRQIHDMNAVLKQRAFALRDEPAFGLSLVEEPDPPVLTARVM